MRRQIFAGALLAVLGIGAAARAAQPAPAAPPPAESPPAESPPAESPPAESPPAESPPADPRTAVAVPVDGARFPAALAGIAADGAITFRSGGERRRLKADELVVWGRYRDSDRGAQLLLADGSLLVADLVRLDQEQAAAYSDLFGDIELPLSAVRSLLFQPSVDPAQRDAAWRRLARSPAADDQLRMENGDLLDGTLQSLAATEDGTAFRLLFSRQGQSVELPLDKVSAVRFNPALVARIPATGRIQLGLRDGSWLMVDAVETAATAVTLRLAAAVRLQAHPDDLWPAICLVQPAGGRVVYLSDREPAGYKHVPLLTAVQPLGRDGTPPDGGLRVGGDLVRKGLSMPSASRVAYELDQPYRRFEADVVLDDRAAPSGSAIFRVFGDDGSGAWRRLYESPPVRAYAPPQPVSVDLQGVRRLALIVDMADRGDVQDWGNWCYARWIR
jgi:hypothetical protein